MHLYILPAPLSRVSGAYWMYPRWKEVAQKVRLFFVERLSTARSWLKSMGIGEEARLFEWSSQKGDWEWEAYEAVFGQRAMAALLSDAGLPGVADPGTSVVRRAHAEGYKIIPLAGPSSVTLALAASGLSGQSFTFWGYPPVEKQARRKFLFKVFTQAKEMTQILMETPARNQKLFMEILEKAPPTLLLCVAHHLTAEEGFVRTKPISHWEKVEIPKAPTLFLLGR
ncbi:MAG: SAM-dependent methyltransferase [Bacteroidia bacterium]|nr:SAM-dependent methyltransferase [Bacteroidia bacterium]MDW8134754.1 SAM-dependent methyltransferase [Bacteroidia bacterium]